MVYEKKDRRARSDIYQYKICEVSVDGDLLTSFRIDQGSYNQKNQEYLELKDALKDRFVEIIKTNPELTKRQREIILLMFDGLTQVEIAAKLNVGQGCIAKSFIGNPDHKNNTTYGGTIKKLKRICFADPKTIEILEKIKEITED